MILYMDMANMLTIPGSANVKNNRHGGMVANAVLESSFTVIILSGGEDLLKKDSSVDTATGESFLSARSRGQGNFR